MVLTSLSLEELCRKLDVAFAGQDGSKGTHAVLNTHWFQFLEEFSDLGSPGILLGKVCSQEQDLDVLDIGCGSSLTLFQAIEALENQVHGIKVNGYGLTASPQFLNRGCPDMGDPEMKERMLKDFVPNSPEYRRVELLFQGVQENEENGLYRFTPKGNLIKLRKGDAHYLERVFDGQRFNMIYSSAVFSLLFCPWLAFEQSVTSLKRGGILLIDGIPTREIVNTTGDIVPLEQYKRIFEGANQGYKIHFKSSSLNIPKFHWCVSPVDKVHNQKMKGGISQCVKNHPDHATDL